MQHDVTIPDAQRTQLANLPAAWDKFQGVLEDAAASLDDAKENFREKVRGMVDTFGGEVAAVAEGFTASAPFSNTGFTTTQVTPLALNQCPVTEFHCQLIDVCGSAHSFDCPLIWMFRCSSLMQGFIP
jgi:hypothetical protein